MGHIRCLFVMNLHYLSKLKLGRDEWNLNWAEWNGWFFSGQFFGCLSRLRKQGCTVVCL